MVFSFWYIWFLTKLHLCKCTPLPFENHNDEQILADRNSSIDDALKVKLKFGYIRLSMSVLTCYFTPVIRCSFLEIIKCRLIIKDSNYPNHFRF